MGQWGAKAIQEGEGEKRSLKGNVGNRTFSPPSNCIGGELWDKGNSMWGGGLGAVRERRGQEEGLRRAWGVKKGS